MITTFFLAQLFGVLFIIKGLFLLLRSREVKKLLDEFIEGRVFTYVFGMLLVVVGLLLVAVHNMWRTPLEVVISLVAWLTLLKGIFSVFAPRALIEFWHPFVSEESNVRGIAFAVLLLGAYLLYTGIGF